MKEFLENALRYPKYLIVIVIGLATFLLKPLAPLMQKPVTAIALITAFVGAFVCLVLVLRAMLGLDGAVI